jgi:cytochrome c
MRRLSACVVGLLLAGTIYAAADAQRGAHAFRACAACHAIDSDRHLTGPSLYGIWGRKAAEQPSYRRYSDALKRSGLVWDEKTLDAWLRDPEKLVPGNAMTFAGLPQPQARADLIAFLKAASEGKAPRAPQARPLPELKKAAPELTVASIRHCGDSYFVTNAKDQTRGFWEFNLRFKTDSSASGPEPGKPVLVSQGMQGDRAQVVFSNPAEISRFIREGC